MKNCNTNKRYFEAILTTSTQEASYIINDTELKLINSFEDDEYIGFEVFSNHRDAVCQSCGQIIYRIKDTRISYPTIGYINKKPVMLKLHRKLYYCIDCNRSTIDQIDGLESYAQKSSNFIRQIMDDIITENISYSNAARRYKISVSNVLYHFDRVTAPTINLSTIDKISIDEVKFIPQSGNYQCVIADADTGHVITILENRFGQNVQEYFQNHLSHIQMMTQDFWEPYKNAIKNFSHQVEIVVDRFHFVRFGMWAYNRTRVSIQKSQDLPLAKSWKLQNKSRHRLSKLSKRKVDAIINQNQHLKFAYKAKEYYLYISRLRNIEDFRFHLEKWRAYVWRHELNEFYFILKTLDNWSVEIENMVISPYTNGSAERINRTIKQAKNIAFGFKNLQRATKLIQLRLAS